MNITSKQRAYLRKLANPLPAVVQIGKGDITPAVAAQVEEVLAVRELVKIALLRTAETGAQQAAQELAEKLSAVAVSAVGRRFVLYRPRAEEPEIILP